MLAKRRMALIHPIIPSYRDTMIDPYKAVVYQADMALEGERMIQPIRRMEKLPVSILQYLHTCRRKYENKHLHNSQNFWTFCFDISMRRRVRMNIFWL